MEADNIKFKKLGGKTLVTDVVEYAKNYCQTHDNIDLIIGTDSQNKDGKTIYCTTIAFYDKGDGEHGHGGHCIFGKWTTPRERDRNTRLLNEVNASIKVANILSNAGVKVSRIDFDINTNPKFKSNEVSSTAKAMCEWYHYDSAFKGEEALVTSISDWMVKKR